MNKIFKYSFYLIPIIVVILVMTSCKSDQSISLQGIIQGENPDKKSFTLKTSDDKTIEILVDTQTRLDIKNTEVDSINFEPGLSVNVEIDGKYAKLVEVNLAKIYGIIMKVEYSDLTLQPYGSSQQIEIHARLFSKILKAGSTLPLNLLTMGRIAEVYFNPVTKTAFQISEMPEDYVVGEVEEGSRTAGIISKLEDGKLTINTAGGIPAEIMVDLTTAIIKADGSKATLEELKPGQRINAVFNPFTTLAIKIEIVEN